MAMMALRASTSIMTLQSSTSTRSGLHKTLTPSVDSIMLPCMHMQMNTLFLHLVQQEHGRAERLERACSTTVRLRQSHLGLHMGT